MNIFLKKNPAKFHHGPFCNDGAIKKRVLKEKAQT